MQPTHNPGILQPTRHSDAGLTLIEVVVAVALAALSAIMLYPTFLFANSIILSNRQRLEAESLAMDKIMRVLNTYDFKSILLATNLPPDPPPFGSSLPANSEIRTMIVPNSDSETPYKWDIEVRVRRDVIRTGGRKIVLTNDIVYRTTRYDIERN